MLGIIFPKLSEYDPFKGAEGALDPLGLYTIADRLAMHLVPGIRERMSHPRFLTAMAVGTVLTRNFDEDFLASDGQSEPYLVYEWHMVEGIVRSRGDDSRLTGLPGIQKTRDCIHDNMQLSSARYLKTASVFGFHGVYRLLADNIDIVRDGMLGDSGYELLTTWEKEQGLRGFCNGNNGPGHDRRQQIHSAINEAMTKGAVVRSRSWSGWQFFGDHLFPNEIPENEKKIINRLLLSQGKSARSQVLNFLATKPGREIFIKNKNEKLFHNALRDKVDENTVKLLDAISAYERFSRLLQDAFDDCLAAMTERRGKIDPIALSSLKGCQDAHRQVLNIFEDISYRLEPFNLLNHFREAFGSLDDKTSVEEWVNLLLAHHMKIQRQKPPNGKNSWFDRFDDGAVMIRAGYRRTKGGTYDGSYLHAYRTNTLWSFLNDLGLLS